MAAEGPVEVCPPVAPGGDNQPTTEVPDLAAVPMFGADAPVAGTPELSGGSTVGSAAGPVKGPRQLEGKQDAESGAPRTASNGEPEEPLRGLYFVRVPKPDLGDETAVQRFQQEFEVKLAAVNLLKETRRMKRLEKNEAKSNSMNALDTLKSARELVKKKEDALRPFWKRDEKNRESNQALRNSRSELDAETEAQLDQKIADIEYSLEHESHELREEKAMLQQIKKLKAQRPKVQKYEASHSHLQEMKSATEEVRASRDVLERELKVLRDERQQCERVHKELRALEDKIAEELARIEKEVDAANTEKNNLYEKLKEARAARKEKLSDFNQNREFSRKVRTMVAEGRIDEAQTQCNEYSERLMFKLKTDNEYRDEYLRLWATQRKSAISMFGVSDADLGISSKKPAGRKAAAGSILDIPLKPGQTRADAVIARALAEADAELKGSRASEEPVSSPELGEPKPIKKEKPAKKDSALAKSKEGGKLLLAGDEVVDDTFEIPEAIKAKDEQHVTVPQLVTPKVVDPEALQKRKDRRKAQAEKRRQKAIEQNKERIEENRRMREEAEQRLQAKQVVQGRQPDASESDREHSATGEAEPVIEAKVQQRKVPPSALPKKVFDTGRRPMPRKKKQGVKGALQTAMDVVEKNQLSIAVGSFIVFMVVLVLMWSLQ